MSKRALEAWLGLVIFLAAAALYGWGIAAWVEPSDFAQIPPDLFPRVAVGCIMVLSALMVISRVLSRDHEAAEIRWHVMLLCAMLIAMFAAGVAAMLWWGYVLGGSALVAGLMWFMGVRQWMRLISVSISTPLALYVFFEVLLGIPMP